MARARRADWIAAGVLILKAEGERRITIERLCTSMGKSKGSFYHHFEDRRGFLKALLEHWEELQTSRFIELAEIEPHGVDRLHRLDALALGADLELERRVRIWGHQDELAAEALGRVDKRRVDYLASVLEGVVDDETLARDLSLLEYMTLIGMTQIKIPLDMKTMERLSRLLRSKYDINSG